jgi:hypothetical protein
VSGTALACTLEGIPCLKQQGRACVCGAASECARTAASCSPPPECPASVASAIGDSAKCLDARASFPPDTAPVCTCGCASCAEVCDGQGPIVGAGQAVHYNLAGSLPTSGSLGVMARVRGGGQAIAFVLFDGAPEEVLGPLPADSDFADHFPTVTGAVARYAWTVGQPRPVAIELRADPLGPIEVDCVVPFLGP